MDDLLEALQRLALECEARSPIQARFEVLGEMKEMDPIFGEEVYRIACEGIRNAFLHSEGSRIDVELRYSKNFTLRISDNGKGISRHIAEEGKAGHFGIRGMKERALRIGGDFSLVTSAGSGTQITLLIPGSLVFKKTNPVMPPRLAKLRALFRRPQR